MIDNFIIERLKVIERTIRRNEQLAKGELTGKSYYIAPQYTFEEVLKTMQELLPNARYSSLRSKRQSATYGRTRRIQRKLL